MKLKKYEPLIYSAIGLLALLLILAAVNFLVSRVPARAAIAGEDQALRVAGRRRAGAAARLRAARGRHAARVQAGGGLQPDRGALQPEARLGGRGRGAARRHRAAAALHRRAVLPRRRGEPARSQAGD